MALDPRHGTLHCSRGGGFCRHTIAGRRSGNSSGNTGDSRNLLVIRRGATAESTSQITPEQYRIIRYLQGIERDSSGVPLASSDLSLVINVPREGRGEANAIIRGVSPLGAKLRPQVRLTAGRWFTPGKREVIVSERLAARLAGMQIGESFKTGPATLQVVGHFNGNRSAFDSEIWMDSDEARSIFDRENYSSVLLRPASDAARERLIRQLDNDKRFKLRGLPEVDYYQEQIGAVKLIKILGSFLATTMSIGAVFAAMNTMYASVELARERSARFASSDFDVRASSLGFWPKEPFSRSSAEPWVARFRSSLMAGVWARLASKPSANRCLTFASRRCLLRKDWRSLWWWAWLEVCCRQFGLPDFP